MLRKFIWSFSKLGDLESAYAALQHVLVLARQGRASFKVSSTGKYQSSALDIPIPAKEKLQGKMDAMTSLVFKVNPEINVAITEASLDGSNMQRCNDIKNPEVEKYFESHFCSNTIDAFLSETTDGKLLNMLNKGKIISEAPEMFDGVAQNNPNSRQDDLSELSTEKMKQGPLILSRPLMNLLRWSFNDMIHACAHSNNYQLAERLFLQVLLMLCILSLFLYFLLWKLVDCF